MAKRQMVDVCSPRKRRRLSDEELLQAVEDIELYNHQLNEGNEEHLINACNLQSQLNNDNGEQQLVDACNLQSQQNSCHDNALHHEFNDSQLDTILAEACILQSQLNNDHGDQDWHDNGDDIAHDNALQRRVHQMGGGVHQPLLASAERDPQPSTSTVTNAPITDMNH
jgi:hypothetical protein